MDGGHVSCCLDVGMMTSKVEYSLVPDIDLVSPLDEYMKMMCSVSVGFANDDNIGSDAYAFEELSQCSRCFFASWVREESIFCVQSERHVVSSGSERRRG